jgi:sialic acid synthase SpsE
LKADDLTLKKPGTGLPPARLADIIGRRLKRSVTADTLIEESDFE